MAYNLHYKYSWYADKDVRTTAPADRYEAWIRELDYVGAEETLVTQDSPVTINYQNVGDNKLEALRGSEATSNLIATEDFQLEELFTENERKYVKQIRRFAGVLTVDWDMTEINPVFADCNLRIYVNGVIKVDSFIEESGFFKINRGDLLTIEVYSILAWPTVFCGLQLEVSREPTLRTVTNGATISYTNIEPDDNIQIFAYSTYSADTYTAIHSEVFYNSVTGYPITFTRDYTSLVSQADAQAQADADLLFDHDGQIYADAFAIYPAIWRGFIIPDGCQEAFTFTPYPISVNAIEGQGLLKNLSFVDNDGNTFIGRYTFIDILNLCLRRIGIPDIILNTCVNIYEVNMTQGDEYDPLELTYVNGERYLKDDGFTPMNCQEVVESVLQEWTACLIMSEGEWWIYRPNEAAESSILTFRRYYDGVHMFPRYTVTKNINELLGGESEGEILAPLFHINGDQLKLIDKAYKNASYSYRYGFNPSEIVNPSFDGWDGSNFPDWTKTETTTVLSEDPNGGAKIGWDTVNGGGIVTDTPVPVITGAAIRVTVSYQNENAFSALFQVKLTDGVDTYSLWNDGSWRVGNISISERVPVDFAGVIDIESQPIPIDGDITVILYSSISDATPLPDPSTVFVIYKRVDITGVPTGGTVGEIHTAEQTEDFTFVPETKMVFNGDSPNDLFQGDMYLAGDVLTTLWNRRGIAESALAMPYAVSKPFLRIAAEETVRLYGSAFVRFEGSVFGYFNPLSRFYINLLTGKFMPLSISYDLQTNIHKVVLGRVDNTEIEMNYTLTGDYGETQKVTIK